MQKNRSEIFPQVARAKMNDAHARTPVRAFSVSKDHARLVLTVLT